MATKSPPPRPTSTITWLLAPEITISPASVARATVGELAMYTSSISNPACFKKPVSFITQNGELSALTADQAMTNFSARAIPEKSNSETAKTPRIFMTGWSTDSLGFCQGNYESLNIYLEIRLSLTYGPCNYS